MVVLPTLQLALGDSLGKGSILRPETVIGCTADNRTGRVVLFSGIEVKRESGSKDEALSQLAIWLCAGLESHRQLAEYPAEHLLPVVGWTVVGHDWHMYIAYRALNHRGLNTMFVVSRWTFPSAQTRDVLGLCKILHLIRKMEVYAKSVYWPWLQKVLEKRFKRRWLEKGI
ncbi:hypothetical protein K432DRAFT_397107 [Lepidopterella palustris CBS 459.81]|uniref:PD-(D/E)XK nuclease-like domain-containing protein n=1 Tax=Lepidopterella palustris CBS 459.81 TaxID=1314670 RepID=A0A8E2JAS5_9PEZI|nr:hypothetical protein K432DRAFT_397107 [Lepidopterella palustris CBS 459.81]